MCCAYASKEGFKCAMGSTGVSCASNHMQSISPESISLSVKWGGWFPAWPPLLTGGGDHVCALMT